MIAFNVLSVMSIAAAFVTAHPLSEQLSARQFSSVTSTHSATTKYESLSSDIRTLRQNIETGHISVAEARSKIESFSHTASSTFSAINGCSTCYTGGSASFMTHYAQETYSELSSLVQTCNQVYGQQAPNLLSSLTHLDSQTQRNLKLFSQSGVAIPSILPPTFSHTMHQAGFTKTSSFANSFRSGSPAHGSFGF